MCTPRRTFCFSHICFSHICFSHICFSHRCEHHAKASSPAPRLAAMRAARAMVHARADPPPPHLIPARTRTIGSEPGA
jgi:hypothetical protein